MQVNNHMGDLCIPVWLQCWLIILTLQRLEFNSHCDLNQVHCENEWSGGKMTHINHVVRVEYAKYNKWGLFQL